MNLKIVRLIVCVCFTVVLSTLASSVSATAQPATNSTVTPQKKMTQEDWMNLQSAMETIHTPFGQFNRIVAPQKLRSDEIAYSVNDVTANTKQLITDNGVFLKQN